MRKFIARAFAPDDFNSFEENIETDLVLGKKNTVFIENIISQFKDKEEILDLLEEHVKRHLVKIGKKFYRQKEGIAQGSVVSSLLCNYFYADLEARHLSFLDPAESLLLRLTDDFLLITTNCTHAKLFLDIMHAGLPAYGVRVNPDKTLVNFEATVQGGSFINTNTLNISKDRERKKDMGECFCFRSHVVIDKMLTTRTSNWRLFDR
jgi:telomerase reverse transcriptase